MISKRYKKYSKYAYLQGKKWILLEKHVYTTWLIWRWNISKVFAENWKKIWFVNRRDDLQYYNRAWNCIHEGKFAKHVLYPQRDVGKRVGCSTIQFKDGSNLPTSHVEIKLVSVSLYVI